MSIERIEPDYKKIYTDIIAFKHTDKHVSCKNLLTKTKLSILDVIELNNIIFGTKTQNNQKYKAYDRCTIIKILQHQKTHALNNTQLAKHFNLSKNTVTKWKKRYII